LIRFPHDRLGSKRSDGAVMLPSAYLAEKLTPHPLPTTDGGVLRTIGDARAYILTLPKTRKSRAHWKRAGLLLLEEVGAAVLTWQVQVALIKDGKLDPAFEGMSNARRWRDVYKDKMAWKLQLRSKEAK
jgi:hypothetical protein